MDLVSFFADLLFFDTVAVAAVLNDGFVAAEFFGVVFTVVLAQVLLVWLPALAKFIIGEKGVILLL